MTSDMPNIYTTVTIILFLLIIIAIAYVVRSKSKSLKKIINSKNKINVLEYLPIRGGFSSFVISVNQEEFFFIGHKSGHGNLVQIQKSYKSNEKMDEIKFEKEVSKSPKQSNAKPLQHVNISDLLALHKKG